MGVRRGLQPERVRPPLYDGSVIDDLLFGQPSNLVMRGVQAYGRRRRVAGGATTVVVVNWNTVDVLRVTLAAVRRYSPPETEIIVIDNGSTDASWTWLSSRPHGCRAIRLPVNIGHGKALDIGFALASNEVVVTLDSDAFPYRQNWLEVIREPMDGGNKDAAGMWGRRDRLHPACAAYRRSTFYDTRMSMANHATWIDTGEEPVFLENCWDTGELVFMSIGPGQVHLFPIDHTPHGGLTMADVVYHHEAYTTMTVLGTDERDASAHAPGWAAAVAALLPDPG